MKKNRFLSVLIAVTVLLLVAAIGFSGYKAASIWLSYKKADDEYADLRALLNQTTALTPETSAPSSPAAALPPATRAATLAATEAPATEGTASPLASTIAARATAAGETSATTANTTPAEGTVQTAVLKPLIQKDFSQLLAVNEDAVGWITLEGTPIDYPIVQGDDNAFYLDHLFSGSGGFAGTLFIDADNMSDFSDKNTVIFGHHLKNGSMFAALSNYRDQKYYDEHPVLYLYTSTGDYEIQVFAGYARDASAIPHDFDAPEDFAAYIDQAVALSDFTSEVEIGSGDRIISLVTCSYVTDNARFVVHGKLVPLYAEAGN